jgi:hypothetical protein
MMGLTSSLLSRGAGTSSPIWRRCRSRVAPHRRRIPMKAHRAYWRDHTLPVFGVVHDGERGYWADLTEALKDDANLASVSTTQPLDASPEPPPPRRRRQGRVVTRPFPAAPAFPQVTSRSPARMCPSSAEVGPVFAIDGRCTKS